MESVLKSKWGWGGGGQSEPLADCESANAVSLFHDDTDAH